MLNYEKKKNNTKKYEEVLCEEAYYVKIIII